MKPSELTPVLVLPGWYPSRVDAFTGDFIQRHVNAISIYCRQQVIFVVKDEHGKITRDVLTEKRVSGNVEETILYYYSPKTKIGFINRFLSQQKYHRIFRNAIRNHIKQNGIPALVHVHIALKAGLQAIWIKKRWHIPYILSEHWTAYLKEADIKIDQFPGIYKRWINKVIKSASTVTVVSNHLGKAMQQFVPSIEYKVIPNVVNTAVFFPSTATKPGTVSSFIHISSLNYQKNIFQMLKAFSLLKMNNIDFRLVIVGPPNPELEEYINTSNLKNEVTVNKEVGQPELATMIQQADALVLFSRFETFGCVVIEANACGIPAILSKLDVFNEFIEPGVNGIFAEPDNAQDLFDKIKDFISRKPVFDKQLIAKATSERFGYEVVGRQFYELYRKIIPDS